MTGHLLIYHPAFIKLQRLIKSGYIGVIQKIYSIRTSYKKGKFVSDITWDYAPHDISMIQRLITDKEQYVKIVSSKKKKYISEANVKLIYSKNLTVKIFLSWNIHNKIQKFKVIGKKKNILFNDINKWINKLEIYDKYNNYLFNINLIKKEPLLNECQYFLNIIKNNKQSLTNGHVSEKNIGLIEKINKEITIQNE